MSASTTLLTLTPLMESEVDDWLRTVGGAWVRSQEDKYGVPADVWFARINHLTRQSTKLAGGFNAWNTYQKWWKHHHPEERRCADDEGKSYLSVLTGY